MAAQGLKDYLERYVDKPAGADGAKTKKKKKSKGKSGGGGNAGSGVIIVDDDAIWHRELKEEDEDEPDEEGEGPQVIEDVEVKRMHRMEALKTHRPYLSMANDGSGWVTVKDDEARGGDNSAPRSPAEGKSPDLSSRRKRIDSPDLSPTRRRRGSPDLSPRRRRRNDSPGLSPPRRRRDSPDLSSPRGRNDSPDLSPPRRRETTDLSPPRRRNDSPDLSPPRGRKGFPDLSSPRRKDSPGLSSPRRRHDSLQENSPSLSTKRTRMDSPDSPPPRRRKGLPDVTFGKRNLIPSQDLDPPRRSKFSTGGPKLESRGSSPRRRRDSADMSPPRRRHDSPVGESRDISTKRKGDNSPDLSASRRRQGSVDLSPPRRSKISSGDSMVVHRGPPRRSDSPDLSPPRRRRDSPDVPPARKSESKDLSSPRKPKNAMASPKQNRSQDSSPPRKKGSARMLDGTYAGLKSDREVVSEAERKRATEAKMLSELDSSLSGRGAETVFRDKRGRRLEGLEEMLRQQRGEVKPAEQPLEWGKGLAQKKVAEANFAELEAEKSRPFARYRDDAELDKSLKERLRWGDPMAHLVKQKNAEPVLEDLGAREEMKASGFIVPQDIPKHSWLKRGIAPPPNRYDIRPGRHWDGVDRSTGYEQGLFKSKNEKKARDLEAYLWSVSDM